MTLRMLDLFSGIGGFSLAADSVGIETVAFCENGNDDKRTKEYLDAVLNRHWPTVPVFPDVKELTADALGAVHNASAQASGADAREVADSASAGLER